MGLHSVFLSLVILTFDLDIQTRPSEGPNIPSVNLAQIRSAVQEIFDSHAKENKKKQKVTDSAKTEPYAVHCMQ